MDSATIKLPKELEMQIMGKELVGTIIKLLVDNNLMNIPIETDRNYSTGELLTIIRSKVPNLDNDILDAIAQVQNDLSSDSNS